MPQFVVCPACEGTGRDASTAYVITQEDLDIQCGDDWDARRRLVSDVAALTQACPCCLGVRVVTPAHATEWEDAAYERALIESERYYERLAGC